MPAKKKASLVQRVKKCLAPKREVMPTFHWNVKKYPDVLKDIEQAKSTFDTFTSKGFTPHYLDAKGNKGAKMTEFDASAGAMIFVPKN